MLNVNWEKIHSIILSVTCHGLRNFAPAHTHPLKTICEFSKPYKLLFSELESLIKCNHKIRVQECYGGRAMSLLMTWGGWRAYRGAHFGRHAAPMAVSFLLLICQILYLLKSILMFSYLYALSRE